jgi:2'-hydroxyisoflavone reductase
VTTSRRDFIRTSTAGAIGAGLLPASALALAGDERRTAHQSPRVERAAAPLRILILGGTGFIGPHQVEYARRRGHTVTLFNRGRTNPGLFPDVEKLHGDRATGDYAALAGREWDVVIDNPTTFPSWVRQAAEALKGRARHYVFVSTISVYAANDTAGADETAAVATTTTPDSEDRARMGELYGPLKALSEQEAMRAFPGHATIVRPGLIVGPGDLSDRFTYWPVRVRRGGEILAPGAPTDPVQIIDARDLAEFIVRLAERGTAGVYNATGPQSRLGMAEMLGAIRGVVSTDARLTWVDADFLEAQRVQPWSEMPVWVPARGETAGFASRSIARALAAGLTFRPLADTARATLEYYDAQPEPRRAQLRAGIAPEKEQAVLAAWHARTPTAAKAP